jgi:hypothetical protein
MSKKLLNVKTKIYKNISIRFNENKYSSKKIKRILILQSDNIYIEILSKMLK